MKLFSHFWEVLNNQSFLCWEIIFWGRRKKIGAGTNLKISVKRVGKWENEETKLSDSYDNICPAGSGHENTKSCKNKPNDNFHKWVSSRPPSVGDRVNVVLPPHRSGGIVDQVGCV